MNSSSRPRAAKRGRSHHPEGQIWDCAGMGPERQLDALKVVSAAMKLDTHSECHQEIKATQSEDPFNPIPGSISESSATKARRAAFNACLTHRFVDWVDERAESRVCDTKSPTLATKVRTPAEWRKMHRSRQEQLVKGRPGLLGLLGYWPIGVHGRRDKRANLGASKSQFWLLFSFPWLAQRPTTCVLARPSTCCLTQSSLLFSWPRLAQMQILSRGCTLRNFKTKLANASLTPGRNRGSRKYSRISEEQSIKNVG
jgi:hypothetical protein